MTTKVLVVDSEPDLEMLIEQKFRKRIQNKEILFTFTANGEEALLKLFDDDEIEVVITDVKLPGIDGFELLFSLQKLGRLVKSVIVTPYGDLDSIRTAMNLGAYDFVTKPINLDDLEATIIKTIIQLDEAKKVISNQTRLADIEKELDVAKSIQSSIIPHHFDPFPGNSNFEVLGTMLPARRIGGDFFDFFTLPGRRLGFSIADVSGKGIPAALFMTMSRGFLRSLGQKTTSPLDCVTQLNELLTLENESSMFVTGFYGILDIETGLVTYCNAGHNPPYIVRADGTITQIARSEGIALGITTDIVTYTEDTFQMYPNDLFLLYTDGITEAMNVKKELYQESKLETILKDHHKEKLGDLVNSIIKDVQLYSTGTEQTDDITLFAIRYLNPS